VIVWQQQLCIKENFLKKNLKIFHPGGNIGSSLLLAKDIMVTGKKMPSINYKKILKKL
jgi:hypothetical protein